MGLMVISDIHGNKDNLVNMINKARKEQCRLLILGDFCSYYDDSLDIAKIVNDNFDIIEAVYGNSDTKLFLNSINKELLDKKTIFFNNKIITFSHGHLYNEYNLPNETSDIYFFGHTHRKKIEKKGNKIIANPGSLSKPRDGVASYIFMDEKFIYLKNKNDELIKKINYND